MWYFYGQGKHTDTDTHTHTHTHTRDGLPQKSQVHIIVRLAATGSFLAFRLAIRPAVRLSSKADMAFEQHCLQTLLSRTHTHTHTDRQADGRRHRSDRRHQRARSVSRCIRRAFQGRLIGAGTRAAEAAAGGSDLRKISGRTCVVSLHPAVRRSARHSLHGGQPADATLATPHQ